MLLIMGRDLEWWRATSKDDQIRYLAAWNLTQKDAAKPPKTRR